MRCPACRKKVHPDDIYCVFCGASLRRQIREDPWITHTHKTRRTFVRPHKRRAPPVSRQPADPMTRSPLFVLGMLLPVVVFVILAVAISFRTVSEIHNVTALTPETRPVPAEASPLGQTIVRQEGITVTADYITADQYYVEVYYTVDNQSGIPITCTDAAVTAGGCTVPASIYFEVPPGSWSTDVLYIESDLLQAAGITDLTAMELELTLSDTITYEPLFTAGALLDTGLTIPSGMPVEPCFHPLVDGQESALALIGWRSDPAGGVLELYFAMENRTEEAVSCCLEHGFWNDEAVNFFGWDEVSPGRIRMMRISLYDLDFSQGESVLRFSLTWGESSTADTVALTFDAAGDLLDCTPA